MLQNTGSIQKDPPIKKGLSLFINCIYPTVEVKVSKSLSTFESAVQQLLHPALKLPRNTEGNGDESSIFVNAK